MAEAQQKSVKPPRGPKPGPPANRSQIGGADGGQSSSSSGVSEARPDPPSDSGRSPTPQPSGGAQTRPRDSPETPRDAPARARARASSVLDMEVEEGETAAVGDEPTAARPPLSDGSFAFEARTPAAGLGPAFVEYPPRDPATVATRLRAQLRDLSRDEYLSLFRTDPRFMATMAARGFHLPNDFGVGQVLRSFAETVGALQTLNRVAAPSQSTQGLLAAAPKSRVHRTLLTFKDRERLRRVSHVNIGRLERSSSGRLLHRYCTQGRRRTVSMSTLETLG